MKLSLLILATLGLVGAAVVDVAVNDFKIGVLAKDQQPGAENLKSLAVFSKLPSQLSADSTQRLYISFKLNKKSDNGAVKPQQVFVRFEAQNGDDAVFVASPDASGAYVLDMLLRTAAKDFHGLTGNFKASLIVGDATIKNPIDWTFGEIKLALPSNIQPVPKSQKVEYAPLKEIRHIFRQPEKRPSAAISDLFTLICLSPLVLLIALWLKVGINFENAPASIWVPLFHVGLAGIFVLYFFFWIELNMFETLKYLALLGFATFVAGNRILRSLASEKSKTE